jgi:hypothetical protein
MDWERIGKAAGKALLLILEYFFKFAAFMVAGIVLSADGTFGAKLAAGFGSLSPVLRQLFETPGKVQEVAGVVHDYNTLTAAAFNEQYGAGAVHGVLSWLNEGVLYFQAVYQNLVRQPFTTLAATVLAFLVLYLLARVLRFARQKGQGSVITRVERRLGERVFRSTPSAPKSSASSQTEEPTVSDEYLRKRFGQGKIRS